MSQLKRYNGTSWEVVGGMPAPKTATTTSDTDVYSCNYVNNLNTYSTSEIRIGTYLGKPLYRKVITGTFAYDTQTITDIITDYDKVIKYNGTITTPSGYITQIPEYTNSSNYCYFVLNTANDNATLTIPSSFVGGTFILIVEYTKATN